MTYTHKLARRLAITHMAALSAVVVGAACSGGDATGPRTPSPDLTATLSIAPTERTVAINEKTKFVAFGRTAAGDSMPVSEVDWSATGGSVDSTGVFAATLPGTYRLVGRWRGRPAADTAVVIVQPGASAPDTPTPELPPELPPVTPPVTPPAPTSNEPAGFQPITERPFNGADEGPGWGDGPDGNIAFDHDPAAPKSPGSVGRMRFPAGMTGGTAPAHAEYDVPSGKRFRKVYMSFWLKVSDNWYGHDIQDKIGYAWIGAKPKLFPSLIGGRNAPLRFQVRTQDLYKQSSLGSSLPLNKGDGSFARGVWHHCEILMVANTPGQTNGEVHWWLDGKKVGEATDIGWVAAGVSDTWEIFSWRPVWGGLGGTIPADQYMSMDHFYASGQ